MLGNAPLLSRTGPVALPSKGGARNWSTAAVVVIGLGVGSFLITVDVIEDYTIRSRVSEGASLAVEAREVIETAHKSGHSLGNLPPQKDLGIKQPAGYRYVQSISVDKNGVITVQLTDHSMLLGASNGTFQYIPTVEGDRLVWDLKCSFDQDWCPRR